MPASSLRSPRRGWVRDIGGRSPTDAGMLGGGCYSNGTCNDGLVCRRYSCVTIAAADGSHGSAYDTAAPTMAGHVHADKAVASADASGATGAPVFLSFGVSTSRLTETEAITFSAVLADPTGIDDLVGGTLQDEG